MFGDSDDCVKGVTPLVDTEYRGMMILLSYYVTNRTVLWRDIE
jgi:hypothetical protein